ncbi:MAG: DEAD/DEAH box helicase, partial [Salibacteraceae bacterium]
MKRSELLGIAEGWFAQRGWKPMKFQYETWRHFLAGRHGMLNAPTGSGKTYALLVPVMLDFIRRYPKDYQERYDSGLQLIWIAPIRALTKEIEFSAKTLCEGLGLNWRIEVRTGDSSSSVKNRQKKSMPEILITTPESLHLILAQKQYPRLFRKLQAFVADEWHELLGTKRAVQVELALSRFKAMRPNLRIWGISATIGNLDEALEVLLGNAHAPSSIALVKANIQKKIEVVTMLPDEIEKFPWAGHIGLKMLEKVLPIIHGSKTTLIFTNTRAQAEIWYQRLLETDPSLAGMMAMHHGSIDKKLRHWVEAELHGERLRAVVCTSSLDLGVDFRPVETIVQIGSPKGVARFLQRAGRSGHQPGATSCIHFLPTNSLELVESAALKQAMDEQFLEHRQPYVRSFDVLVQYLITLAVSEGFYPQVLFKEIQSTFCYQGLTEAEWSWLLAFITHGGESLNHYDEFHKVEVAPDGKFQVTSRRVALRHRLNIGTIVSDQLMIVKML